MQRSRTAIWSLCLNLWLILMSKDRSDSFLPPAWVLSLLGVYAICWLIVELKELVSLVVVGYALAYFMDPLVSFFEKRRINRSVAVLFVFSGLILVSSVLVVLAIPTLGKEYTMLAQKLPSYLQTLQTKSQPLVERVKSCLPEGSIPENPLSLDGITQAFSSYFDFQYFQKISSGLFTTIFRGYSFALALLNLLFMPLIVFYLSADFHKLHRNLLEFVPRTYQKKISKIATEIDYYISAFVRGQLLIGFVLTCLYMLGLGLLRVELWFLLAVISGFGSLIPYMGFIVGIVLSSIMALLTYGDFIHVLYVWGLYFVVQLLEGTLLAPRIIGNRVQISPLVIFLALIAGGKLAGFLGIFLAVPITAALRVVFKHLHQTIVKKVDA